ncbi:p-cresol methylhydroxylase, beta subunit cytochrome c [Geobacter metallireducens GS-15]|uniref:p-cresol methylhydroxylase, beta subunit cytochrome c n=2 Tax=Geobacter metallireducens TaxID=28232 RepID=Q39TS2_GEOMG|nr:p-cresol methylhydroxylase, beta subunit cytochrome c [Geobacter metallireducens GS-15]
MRRERMNRKTSLIVAAALVFGMLLPGSGALAQEPPKMPYVFAMYCVMCHKEGVQIGPIGIYDMMSKSGNPLHEQLIRNNTRFGYNAMPAFRMSEVSPKEMNAIVAYLKDVAAYRKTHPGYKPVPAKEGGAKK